MNTECKSILFAIAGSCEELYLDEWLKYNLKLGFTKIVIFEHNWEFKNKNHYSKNRVEFIPTFVNTFTEEGKFHNKARTNLRSKLIHNYLDNNSDWDLIANFDCDEFLYFVRRYRSLTDLYQAKKDEPIIFVYWRIFGDNELKTLDPKNPSVLKRFTKCDKNLCYVYGRGKTIMTRKGWEKGYRWIGSHQAKIFKDGKLKFDEEMVYYINRYKDFNVELYHYRNKTPEENKIRRGNWLTGTSELMDNFYNKNDIDNFNARNFLYGKEKSFF